jgi:hypothetical protein
MVLQKTKPPAARSGQSDFHHMVASALPFSGRRCLRPDWLGVLVTVGLCWLTLLLMRVALAN